MLKNIFRTFYGLTAALMAAVGVSACSDDNNGLDIPQEQHPEAGYITLNLNCVEGTRATEEGVENYNENLIRTVTLCLWADDGTKPDATAKPDYVQTFSAVNEQNSATLRVPLTEALKKVLFESDPAKCNAFAAVNVTPPVEGFTIAELRNMTIGSTFSSQRGQNSFAMDGDGVVTYNRGTNVATGTIDLQRSASKLTLALSVDQEVTQSVVLDGALITSKWRPDTEHMRVWINGALAESQLDPDMSATPGPGYFFNTPDNLTYTFKKNIENPHKTDKFTYDNEQDMPFYTYPHRWSAEPGDYAATYMTLAIPWMRVNDDGSQVAGSSWRTCYYQVPVISENSEVLQLVRNVAYHIYLHVGLLGSFVPDEPLLLEDMVYSAAEWGNVNMDVNIPDVRYLVVDQNDYTVNNETSIVIPFYTSHETVVTDATMTFYRFNFSEAGLQHPVTVTQQLNTNSQNRTGKPVFTAEFNNKTDELTVTHDLKVFVPHRNNGTEVSLTNNDGPNVDPWGNDGNANRAPKTTADWNRVMNTINYFEMDPNDDEYSKVEFKITLQHLDMKGTPNFSEVITITQYPGIYIEAVTNYYGPENTTSFACSGAQGNAIINGNYGDNTNTYYTPSGNNRNGWCGSIGLYSRYPYYNFNPNLYLVTVTTLPDGTPYRIGNPRSNVINNTLASVNGRSYPNDVLPSTAQKAAWTGTRYRGSHGNVSWDVTTSGFTTAAAIYSDNDANDKNGNNRTLSYYYPTQEDDDHKMMIAPKFRICSSYAGTTWIINRELARRRAAAYQELGYPAGRWRLPTYGEVMFIMELSSQYKIPRLFGAYAADWWYWCAQGLIYVPQKKDSDTKKAELLTTLPPRTNGDPACQRTRFVYDEWYWGEADLKANGPLGS
ncbi:MAG: hypothetical protein K2K25_09490, partial [Muribaculaceae bacterium]|nr:hypothetical protein [Muribaculaceae bacterium]